MENFFKKIKEIDDEASKVVSTAKVQADSLYRYTKDEMANEAAESKTNSMNVERALQEAYLKQVELFQEQYTKEFNEQLELLKRMVNKNKAEAVALMLQLLETEI